MKLVGPPCSLSMAVPASGFFFGFFCLFVLWSVSDAPYSVLSAWLSCSEVSGLGFSVDISNSPLSISSTLGDSFSCISWILSCTAARELLYSSHFAFVISIYFELAITLVGGLVFIIAFAFGSLVVLFLLTGTIDLDFF